MASGTVSPISTSKGPGLNVAVHQFQYPGQEASAQILLFASEQQASQGMARLVAGAAEQAIKAKGSFTLVLSGGALIPQLSALVGLKGVDWSKWYIFYVDERNVPLTSEDSNFKGTTDSLLSKTSIPASQVFALAEGLPVHQAAINYEGRLVVLPTTVLPRTPDNFPVFDMVLLGLGPDGHVASLFPNRAAVAEAQRWVVPVANSPKPPAERITMTLPVINSAKDVVFVAVGEAKAEVVQRVLEVQALPGALPAQMVRPNAGRLHWILDVMSAQHLQLSDWADSGRFPRST